MSTEAPLAVDSGALAEQAATALLLEEQSRNRGFWTWPRIAAIGASAVWAMQGVGLAAEDPTNMEYGWKLLRATINGVTSTFNIPPIESVEPTQIVVRAATSLAVGFGGLVLGDRLIKAVGESAEKRRAETLARHLKIVNGVPDILTDRSHHSVIIDLGGAKDLNYLFPAFSNPVLITHSPSNPYRPDNLPKEKATPYYRSWIRIDNKSRKITDDEILRTANVSDADSLVIFTQPAESVFFSNIDEQENIENNFKLAAHTIAQTYKIRSEFNTFYQLDFQVVIVGQKNIRLNSGELESASGVFQHQISWNDYLIALGIPEWFIEENIHFIDPQEIIHDQLKEIYGESLNQQQFILDYGPSDREKYSDSVNAFMNRFNLKIAESSESATTVLHCSKDDVFAILESGTIRALAHNAIFQRNPWKAAFTGSKFLPNIKRDIVVAEKAEDMDDMDASNVVSFTEGVRQKLVIHLGKTIDTSNIRPDKTQNIYLGASKILSDFLHQKKIDMEMLDLTIPMPDQYLPNRKIRIQYVRNIDALLSKNYSIGKSKLEQKLRKIIGKIDPKSRAVVLLGDTGSFKGKMYRGRKYIGESIARRQNLIICILDEKNGIKKIIRGDKIFEKTETGKDIYDSEIASAHWKLSFVKSRRDIQQIINELKTIVGYANSVSR